MQRLYKKLRKVDSFGRDLKFEEDGIQSFKTEVGAIFTLIMFVLVVILAILFGQEIYQRKLPIVLVSNEIVEKVQIQLSDFPIVLFFADLEGNNFENAQEYVKVEVNYIQFNAENAMSTSQFVGMLPCNPDSFTSHKEFVSELLENAKKPKGMTPYCINHNSTFTIRNQFGQANSSSLMISVHNCHPAEKCPPDLRRRNRMMYVAVSYYNSFFNPKSYNDPVYYYSDIYTKQVSTGMVYDAYIKLSEDEFFSDNGWILESNQNLKAIKVESIKEEVYLPYFERLVRFVFEVSKKKEIVSRSYMKVQELFAKIGGVFNACSLFFNLILYDYILFKFRLNYLNPAMGVIKQKLFVNKETNNRKDVSDSSQPNEKVLNLKYKSIPNSENINNINNKNNCSKELDNSQNKLNAVNQKIELSIKKPLAIDNNSSGLHEFPAKNDKNNEHKNAKFTNNNAPHMIFNNNYVFDKFVSSKTQDNNNSNSFFYDDDLINQIKNLSYFEVFFNRFCCCAKKNALIEKMKSQEMLKKFALTEYLVLVNKIELVSESLNSKIY